MASGKKQLFQVARIDSRKTVTTAGLSSGKANYIGLASAQASSAEVWRTRYCLDHPIDLFFGFWSHVGVIVNDIRHHLDRHPGLSGHIAQR